jgi:PEP-CTERM motif
MKRTTKTVIRSLIVCALVCGATSFSQAATIIKLNLGGVGPDVGMGAPAGQPPGVISTVDQTGGPPPTGDQFTDIEYTGFLNFIPDLNTNTATFSLDGLQASGTANVFGTLVIQNFVNGNFALYDPADNLLLAGPLTNSALTGVIGSPGTGALFTTTLGPFSGGSLAPFIAQGTVSLSMNMTNVNGGNGFDVQPLVTGGTLQPFLADAAISISADFSGVPEPTSMTLVGVALAAVACGWRRR